MAASGVTSDYNTNGYACMKVKEVHASAIYPSSSTTPIPEKMGRFVKCHKINNVFLTVI